MKVDMCIDLGRSELFNFNGRIGGVTYDKSMKYRNIEWKGCTVGIFKMICRLIW